MFRRVGVVWKFFATYFLITGVALAFAGIAGYIQFREHAIEEIDQRLVAQARLVAHIFGPLLAVPSPDRAVCAREGDRIGRNLEIRLTVILPDGTVAADAAVGAASVPRMENHRDRPEVREALAGRTGISTRRSITLGERERYAAVPILWGERIVGVARAAVPLAFVEKKLGRIRAVTWGTGIVAFLLMLAGTFVRARTITSPLSEMRAAARELASGNLSRRVQVSTADEIGETGRALNQMAERLSESIRRLSAERNRLETILENLSEGILVLSGGGQVRLMNREAARILGASEPAPPGRLCPEVVRQPEILAFVDGWRNGNAPPAREIPVPAGEEERVVRIAAARVPGEDAEEPNLLVTLRDLTEEKRLARIKSDFASNASHELRTPLTNIRGYIEAIQDAQAEGAPVDPAFVAAAHQNALRMERLIDDLLALSRVEEREIPLERDKIELRDFLEKAALLHKADAHGAGKSIEVLAADAAFEADARQLLLAVSNLVDNAVKYGGRRIVLSGHAGGGFVEIETADDGPGIPSEHLPRIFERFYRVDKGRSREMGGTGLGLSIARHIVEAHGGTIRVESGAGGGTRFLVRIPAVFGP